jgi:hypothetical protein
MQNHKKTFLTARTLLVLAILGLSFSLSAQEPKVLPSKIEKVTLFQNGAQVLRTFKTTLDKGITVIRITDLATTIDANSLRIDGDGEFMILSYNYKQWEEIKKSGDTTGTASLISAIIELREEIDEKQVLINIAREEERLLNRRLGQIEDSLPFQPSQLAELMSFYSKEISRIRLNILKMEREVTRLENRITKTDLKRRELIKEEKITHKGIEIRLSSAKRTEAKLRVRYFAHNARWIPVYTVTASDNEKPVEVRLSAEIQQFTGEEWGDVQLTLSNGNPSVSGIKPELQPWNLNVNTYTPTTYRGARSSASSSVQKYNPIRSYPATIAGKVIDANTGEAIPFATIRIIETNNGVVTDFDGNFSLQIPEANMMLQVDYVGYNSFQTPADNQSMTILLGGQSEILEAVVVSADIQRVGLKRTIKKEREVTGSIDLPVDVEDKTITKEFVIKTPSTIPSDGNEYNIDISTFNLPANYIYYAVPKEDPDAFLVAEVTGWDELSLLPGAINVYFDNSYVGKSYFDPVLVSDTMIISLGRDKEVVIERTKGNERKSAKVLGSTKEIERNYVIKVQNGKKKKVKIIIQDQIPITTSEDIEITPILDKDAELDKETGIIEWEFEVEPSKSKTAKFGYVIQMPKKYNVY